MKLAKHLILQKHYSQYKAAKEAGITKGAISKAKWYREFKNGKIYETTSKK